jgi:hypothetical protein
VRGRTTGNNGDDPGASGERSDPGREVNTYRLPLLVDQILKVGRPHRAQVGDAQHETDRVQDVGFSCAAVVVVVVVVVSVDKAA